MKRSLPIVVLVLAMVTLMGCTSLNPTAVSVTRTPAVDTGPKVKPTATVVVRNPAFTPAITSPLAITAPNAVESPAVTTGTPVPEATSAMGITDYKSLLATLQASGAALQAGGPTSNSVFTGTGHVIRVNGGEVQVFEYADQAAADTEAALVSSNGAKVGKVTVSWAAPPHFYKQGRLLVVYAGTDTQVTSVLAMILGPQFAGAADSSPAAASTPSATGPASSCVDKARMVKDVTIPDNTTIPAGQSFAKIWRLNNTGACTWDSAYAVVYVQGDQMGAPDAVTLPSPVKPGEAVDVSVAMTAPNSPGKAKGSWKMRSSSGKVFGIENSSDGTFWVAINVSSSSAQRISFPAGGESASFKTTLTQGITRSFVVALQEGQHLTVKTSDNVSLSILDPKGGVLSSVTQAAGEARWETGIPQTGDYTLALRGQGQLSVTLTAPPPSTSTPVPANAERITLAEGTTRVSRSLTLAAGKPQAYVMQAQVNQRMSIIPSQPGLSLTLQSPDGQVLQPLQASGDRTQYRLPRTGDYTLTVNGQGHNSIDIEIPLPGPVSRERVTFPTGTTSVGIRFTLRDGETKEYALRALSNQQMTVGVGSAGLSLLVYGPAGRLIAPQAGGDGTSYAYLLPDSGDYIISVQGAGSNTISIDLPAR